MVEEGLSMVEVGLHMVEVVNLKTKIDIDLIEVIVEVGIHMIEAELILVEVGLNMEGTKDNMMMEDTCTINNNQE